ncbi:DUF2798 domain-containing protein [uncultured Vibrio sp.]|uniref:DUF2798 domain-containing protein n=1 Tax=uncultured Vibrio sp. TaxID=114054 RepID=UPI0025EDE42F|nr:DUF2798 domain-containing protein [uncultured Vibrio sp.]
MSRKIVFGILMSFVLSSLMTLWVTWLNIGFVTDFLSYWGKAFILAWPAATLISIAFSPYVQAFTALLFHDTRKELT